MKFIDVTLRDGGYQNGFNWPFEFFSNKLNLLNVHIEITMIKHY